MEVNLSRQTLGLAPAPIGYERKECFSTKISRSAFMCKKYDLLISPMDGLWPKRYISFILDIGDVLDDQGCLKLIKWTLMPSLWVHKEKRCYVLRVEKHRKKSAVKCLKSHGLRLNHKNNLWIWEKRAKLKNRFLKYLKGGHKYA